MSAAGGRVQLVPGHRHRLLLPPAGGVGHRRSHAHRNRRRSAQGCCRHPRFAGRGDLPLRPVEPSVYTSKAYAKLCRRLGITQSIRAVGTSATTLWPSRSTRPTNARSCKTAAPGPTRSPADARRSSGSPATTRADATPGAATSAPTPTTPPLPLRWQPPRDQPPCPPSGVKTPCRRGRLCASAPDCGQVGHHAHVVVHSSPEHVQNQRLTGALACRSRWVCGESTGMSLCV